MRLSQHDIALQRERLLTEITILSEQEQSQVVIAHKARVLLSTAWFKATWLANRTYYAQLIGYCGWNESGLTNGCKTRRFRPMPASWIEEMEKRSRLLHSADDGTKRPRGTRARG
jgi:hypothetical protein